MPHIADVSGSFVAARQDKEDGELTNIGWSTLKGNLRNSLRQVKIGFLGGRLMGKDLLSCLIVLVRLRYG